MSSAFFRVFRFAVLLLGFATLAFAADATPRTLVFFGDSLTAGYGLDNPDAEAFPALIQKKIAAEKLNWRVVNAGLSGETSSGGLRRVDWILRQPIDLFVLELGANDGLRGINPKLTHDNLQAIIDRVHERSPHTKIVLAGMTMPPSLGEDYVREFTAIYPDLAKKNRLTFLPFLLEGVGGHRDLNQSDGIHPTAAGHEIVAESIWKILRPLL